MIVAGQRLPILVATRPVDFRCGHQALALIVQNTLRLPTELIVSLTAPHATRPTQPTSPSATPKPMGTGRCRQSRRSPQWRPRN